MLQVGPTSCTPHQRLDLVLSEQPTIVAAEDKATLDPLNLDQWEFYVVPTALLNEQRRRSDSEAASCHRGYGASHVPCVPSVSNRMNFEIPGN